MNFHKALNFTKQMAVLLAAVLIITSCGKEQAEELEAVSKIETEKTIADYPEEITLENWEEFVHAPQSVIDHFAQKEVEAMGERTVTTPNEFNETSRFPFILGLVQGFNGAWVSMPGVTVNISGPSCSSTSITNSWANFNYFIGTSCPGPMCMTYNTPAINGVSTFDLVLVQRHILGITPFTTAQQYLAADANRSGTITGIDLVEIRKIILFINTAWPQSDNVLFTTVQDYDDLQDMIDNTGTVDPALLQAVGNVGNCLAPFFSDRQAIKTGDVNGSFAF